MPAAGDYKFCPFLTLTEAQEGSFTVDETTYCDEAGDLGNKGWLDPYASSPGCGRFYDCCTKVTPVACMGSDCFIFDSSLSQCSIGGDSGMLPDNPYAKWVQEYLFGVDLDDDGKIYGHTFLMNDPPPALAGITQLWGKE